MNAKTQKWKAAQALVEFTLLAPVFFLLLLGGLDSGRAALYYVAAADLARTAARDAAAYDVGQGLTDSQIVALVKKQSDSLTMGNLSQPATCGTSTPPNPLTSCYQPSAGQTYIFIDRTGLTAFPKYVKVSIVFHFEPSTPLVRAVWSTFYLVATASMVTEY